MRERHIIHASRRSRKFTDFDSRPLDFRHPPRRYSSHPCSLRAPSGGVRWRSGERRLWVRPRGLVPGGLGSPPASTPWGRPCGLAERMNAGESLPDQETVKRSSVSESRCRGLRKTPRWSAERRAGPRYGPAIPSADGSGPTARRAKGAAFRTRELSALRFPREGEGFETNNLARQSAGMRRAATLPHGSTTCTEKSRCRNLLT